MKLPPIAQRLFRCQFVLALLLHALSSFSTPADSVFVETVLQQYAGKAFSPGGLTAAIGREFLGRPYVGGTLEVNAPDSEALVVNTREVDCTTFVDQVLALVLTALDGEESYPAFCRWLTTLRYRDGVVNGYASRLHYFTDFVADNNEVFWLVPADDGPFAAVQRVELSFMSTHPDSYPALRDKPETIALIRDVESRYKEYPVRFIPKNSPSFYALLKEGDVVALLTTTSGLDVSHLGIAVEEGGELRLLHASSSAGKVLIDSHPLQAMVMGRKSCQGIRAIRLKDNRQRDY